MRALIIGITGMDGSFMADLLLSKGYEVFGMHKHTSPESHPNTRHLIGKVTFLRGDLLDQTSIMECLIKASPDEVYNFAGQSSPFESWLLPAYTCEVNSIGVIKILESLRQYKSPVKFFQASSSEMYGKLPEGINRCNEETQFNPQNPYAVSKLFAHNMARMFRGAYNMFNCTTIAYNHESERRGLNFLTRKITNGVARIHLGLDDSISLGNMNVKKDWGYAPEYVEMAWKIMQMNEPDDYVIATEKVHTIEEFIVLAFKSIGISDWKKYVKQDQRHMRPVETEFILADCSKAKNKLEWAPKISFEDMVSKMVENDIKILRAEQ